MFKRSETRADERARPEPQVVVREDASGRKTVIVDGVTVVRPATRAARFEEDARPFRGETTDTAFGSFAVR